MVNRSIPKQSKVQSVDRALDVLEVFLNAGPELGLTEIAKRLLLNKATAHRLLSVLEERGYVERSPKSSQYRLGYRLFELGTSYQSRLDLRRLALPFMREMVQETGESAFLCIQESDAALCIEQVEAERDVQIFALRLGGRQPLHCGAAPRVLLAGMSDSEIEHYAAHTGLPSFTPHTISSLAALRMDVENIRAQGYAHSIEDVTPGIAAIGAPVRDYTGRVIASISVSGLLAKFTGDEVLRLTQAVIHTAKEISIQMGYRSVKEEKNISYQ